MVRVEEIVRRDGMILLLFFLGWVGLSKENSEPSAPTGKAAK